MLLACVQCQLKVIIICIFFNVCCSCCALLLLKIQYNMQTVDVDGRTTKKLITNLKPKTHYTFTLTNHGNSLSGLQQNVAVRTAPNMLGVKPLVNAKAQLDGSITVVLPDVEMSESVR